MYPAQEPATYLNRDINWLSFNERVLQEAEDSRTPLFERLKFLAIFSSNLDEFFKVRVSQLRQVKKVRKELRKKLALRPNKTIKAIREIVNVQQDRFGVVYSNLLEDLRKAGVHLNECSELNEMQLEFISHYFENKVKEELVYFTTTELDANLFEDGHLYFLVSFKETVEVGLVSIPSERLGRFVVLPSESDYHLTYLDEVIRWQLPSLFYAHSIEGVHQVKLSRDAELYLDDLYSGDLAEEIYTSLSQRQRGQPTRLLYNRNMPRELQKIVRKQLGLGKVDMIAGGNRHNFSDFFDFPVPAELQSGHYPPMPPLPHPALEGKTDLFELISLQDRILHFPYQKFDYIEELIWQAARDRGVKSIKISLYRTAKRSGLTDALLEALKQGKEVTLFIEAQARFDEENNLKWGRRFEKKGATVHYSIRHIKVHSKVLLIERLESEQLRRYAYIGTGNFNAKTAKFYCDHALLTSHKGITADLSQVFKVLQRELIAPKLKHLLVAPFTARTTFEELIMQEIRHARHGLPAAITAKMNSLEDKRMIDRLYEASQAGVRIRLLVRGLCCLVPGIDGLSENIEVTSIVDRFLEHGRLYLFHNNGSELLYMGSADWMTRNLDKRIEVLTPILDPSVGEELKAILDLQLRDNVKARIIDAFASNDFVDPMGIEVPLRSQFAIYDYLGGN